MSFRLSGVTESIGTAVSTTDARSRVVGSENKAPRKFKVGKEERCSFCEEPASSERIMIQAHGKEVRICEECVDLCNDIIANRRKNDQ